MSLGTIVRPARYLLILIWALGNPLTRVNAQAFELHDQDRVVFLGDGLIEQEQYAGWVEVMLTTAFSDRDITFRNLGWSADTPKGASRFGLSLLQAGGEPADEGWKQLQKQIELTKPTVVVLGYGMASSLEQVSVGEFIEQFQQLIRFLRSENDNIRFVFLSPLARFAMDGQAGRNQGPNHSQVLVSYRDAIAELATQSQSPFVDLLKVAQSADCRRDAIHVNDQGYRQIAEAIAEQLKIEQIDWRNSPQTKTLRETIRRKNEWFFHRSRPANMAYVFGFRRREQGQNAVEIPQFDALVAKEEQIIAKLRSLKPTNVTPPESRTKSAFAKFTPQPHPNFTVADGWEVSLWAENPMLNKPIQMNFDAAGRLWVASSEAYPMIEVGQTANDRIIVLEDSDHDGKADKSSVFADGLLIPTGVLPTQDGVYVAQSTDLLFLQDTDGDGQADKKTRVLSGFGTEDTHHNLHTLRWGPDGRLYMNQSVYTRTDAETPRGVTRLKAGGGFRYNPTTMRMQIFFAGLWNSWGHQFDKWGRSFLSDGAGFSGLAYAFPGAQFNPIPYGQRKLNLISPGRYPKFCSLEIVSGDSLPKDWQESIVTCDFRANRVTRFSLIEKESGYETVQEDDLLRTSEATFRPIDIRQGPDGALYIADWSNPIINHGEVDFRDPRRDRWHGRIWRVAYTGGARDARQNPAAPVYDYTKLTIDQLLSHLTSKDRYARDTARFVLKHRPKATKQALAKWLTSQDGFGKLQALWLYQALNQANTNLLEELLAHTNAATRAAATRVLGDWADPQSDLKQPLTFEKTQPWFERLVSDKHPQVRLEAIIALTHQQHPEAARIALSSLTLPTDRFIEFALAEAITDVAVPLLQSIQEQPLPDDKSLEFTLASVPPAKATAFVSSYVSEHPLPSDGSGPWIELIAKSGGAKELNLLYQTAINGKFNDAATARSLNALGEAKRLRRIMPNKDLDRVAELLDSRDERVQQSAIRLAGLWQRKSLANKLVPVIADATEPSTNRLEAVDALAGMRSTKQLREIRTDDEKINARVLAGLAKLAPDEAIKRFLDLQAQPVNDETLVDYWRAVLSNKGNQNRLAKRLDEVRLRQASVQTGLRVAREGGRNAKPLVNRLQQMVGQSFDKLTPKQIAEIARAAQSGDPRRGEDIYAKQELACVTCHAITGIGGQVGPDLSSIGASAPIDYLAESLYLPNAKIKENYHSTMILDADGQQHVGIETGSTPQEIVMRLADNKLVRIPRGEIEDQKAGPSLMPSGLVERLPKQDQIDLIAFLSQLGKPGDFDTSQRNVARQFEVFAGTHRAEQQGLETILSGKAKGWKPISTRVNGDLQRTVIDAVTKPSFNISLVNVYLKTPIRVGTTKKATVVVEGTPDAAMWLDGDKLAVTSRNGKSIAKLENGPDTRELIVRLDARDLPEKIRIVGQQATFGR